MRKPAQPRLARYSGAKQGHLALESRDGLCGNCFTTPHCAYAFICFRFEINAGNVDAEGLRQCLAHGGEMGAQFRPLRDYDGVQVRDPQTPLRQKAADVLQKAQAMHIFPTRIRVREMRADIAEPRGTENRVADSMRQRVSIGMADRSFFERNFDSAEHKLAPCGEPVQVITNPGLAQRPTSAAIRSRLK